MNEYTRTEISEQSIKFPTKLIFEDEATSSPRIKHEKTKATTRFLKEVRAEELYGFEKIGDFQLNTSKSKTLIKFKCSSDEKRSGGHVYIIAVDGFVWKIGASVTSLKKYGGYGVGNGGKPSTRTTGIHYFIARELYRGKEVSFWAQMCPIVRVKVRDVFGADVEIETSTDPKVMETLHIKTFSKKYQFVPEWNKQERGRDSDWDGSIKRIVSSFLQEKGKKVIEYDPESKYDDIMKLYHWKYNNVPL